MKTAAVADMYARLGRRVKDERLARHLTQRELADAAGMDTAHLSRIEHGKAVPSVNMLKKLADALALPLHTLFIDVPPVRLPDYGWAGKMQTLVRDIPRKKQERILRVLKTLVDE